MSSTFTRRSFLIGSAATLAAINLLGCGSKDNADDVLEEISSTPQIDWDSGKWVSAACVHGCGNKCVNLAYVVDGVVLAQRSVDHGDDTLAFPLKKPCARGLSQRKRVFGAGRLKYPMKRKHWEPFTGGKKELRGRDSWERISWDEALDYVAAELKHAREKYGETAVLSGDWNYEGQDGVGRLLANTGGYVNTWSTGSYGGISSAHRYGFHLNGEMNGMSNDRMDLPSCELIVMFGMNPAWNHCGNTMRNILEAKRNGTDFVAVDPFFNDTANLLDAEWIHIRPGTDIAFMLGVAHELIQLDANGKGVIDWDFLKRCCIGFDDQTLPKGAPRGSSFLAYLTGKQDGVKKTPEWASPICGATVKQIKDLAARIGKDRRVALLSGLAPARTFAADHLPQMLMTLGAMTGHYGKPGHMTGYTSEWMNLDGGKRLVLWGSDGLPPIENPVQECINTNEVWDAILTGRYTYNGQGWVLGLLGGMQKPEKRKVDIHVIFHGWTGLMQQAESHRRGIEAHRKVDCVICEDFYFSTNAKYADIVLPTTTLWEGPPGTVALSPRDFVMVYDHVTEPIYEAKSMRWITEELAKRLGVDPKVIYPISEDQVFYNYMSTLQVIEPDGETYSPLVTITQDDIEQLGVDGKPQEGKIGLNELLEQGGYAVPRAKGDKLGCITLQDFRENPEKHPVESESGKLEIYCKDLARAITEMSGKPMSPIPVYRPIPEGYEQTFSSWDKRKKGKFPLQMISPHYPRRSHTIFDNVPQLREAWASPVYVSAADAKAAGISPGDAVLVESEVGAIARPCCISERLMPGVVLVLHGSMPELDEESGIDFGGHDNTLHKGVKATQNISGFNSTLVRISRYPEKLRPDAERPVLAVFEKDD